MHLKLLFPPSLGKPKASARAELLEQALAQELGGQVTVEVAPTYGELERRALTGEAHIIWAPAAICARLEPTARAIYKVVRLGQSTYRSALVARVSDNLALSATKLKGLRAAWVDRLSLGGYLLIADHLRANGIDPDLTFASQTFLGSHPAALGAVIHGQADVAAITVSGDDPVSCRLALGMHGGPASKALAAITISEPAPTDALLFTDKLSLFEAERITERLFPAGVARARSFLYATMEAEGFERARPGEYKPLVRLLRLVDGHAPPRSASQFPSSRPPAPPSQYPSSRPPAPPSQFPRPSAPPAPPSRPSYPGAPPPSPSRPSSQGAPPPSPSRPSSHGTTPPPPSSQPSSANPSAPPAANTNTNTNTNTKKPFF